MEADPALLPLSLGRLCERFRDLRPAGPYPAVMGETPRGAVEVWDRFPPFTGFEGERCRKVISSVVFDGDTPVASRATWLVADAAPLQRFRDASEEAAGWAPLIRRKVGLPAHPPGTARLSRWWWTVFEVAERGIPGAALRLLDDGVVRRSVDGLVQLAEDDLHHQLANPDSGTDWLKALVANREYSATRFWRLADIVEASLMVLTIAEISLPAVQAEWSAAAAKEQIANEQPAAPPRRGGRPHKRDVGGLTVNQWLAAAYMEDPNRRPWSSRQLVKIPGCQWPESTIRKCDLFKSVQAHLEIEERARADDLEEELVAEGEGPGLHLSKRKSRVGRQRRSADEAAADRAADDFLRQHDKKPPRG